jgi:LytS/YehU family sensor histidine kinase
MINKRVKVFLHIAFWAIMFLSPMQYMRGTGTSMLQYVMNCMSPLLMMVMFYANYKWLTPRYFVAGKHRYFFLINLAMIIIFAVVLHYWMDFTNTVFTPNSAVTRVPDALDAFLFVVRDVINFMIFGTAATSLKLAQQWMWADEAIKNADNAKAQAELSNLRNQINPHFLLNTLNNIYALTAFDTPKAQEAIQELSKMLRHILYDYQQPRVPLQDETEFIDNYVKLMRIRLPNSVEVVSKFHVLDKQADVAPMIFISLVENAFKHGVSPTEPSFIHITIEGDRKHVICDIKNSNYPKAEGDHSGHGIGLQQVQRRLELSYYQQYTWEYGVSPDGKTFHSRILITPKRK